MKNSDGYSLLEVLVAIAIFGIVFLALGRFFSAGVIAVEKNDDIKMASEIANSEMLSLLKSDTPLLKLFKDNSNRERYLLEDLFYSRDHDEKFKKDIYIKLIDWNSGLLKIRIVIKWVEERSDKEREYSIMSVEEFKLDK